LLAPAEGSIMRVLESSHVRNLFAVNVRVHAAVMSFALHVERRPATVAVVAPTALIHLP
jgi:hypothetical protein